jgi:hypothetical protein
MRTFNVFEAAVDRAANPESVRMVMFSNRDPIGYCVYVDSNKVSHWTDSPDPMDNVRVRRGQNLDYCDGER